MDFEYAWDFGETSELKERIAELERRTILQMIKQRLLDILNHLR